MALPFRPIFDLTGDCMFDFFLPLTSEEVDRFEMLDLLLIGGTRPMLVRTSPCDTFCVVISGLPYPDVDHGVRLTVISQEGITVTANVLSLDAADYLSKYCFLNPLDTSRKLLLSLGGKLGLIPR